jgi:hypothetical protein
MVLLGLVLWTRKHMYVNMSLGSLRETGRMTLWSEEMW